MIGLLDLPDELIVLIIRHLPERDWYMGRQVEARTRLLLVNKRISGITLAEWLWPTSSLSRRGEMLCMASHPEWGLALRDLCGSTPGSLGFDKDRGFTSNQDFDKLLAAIIISASYLQEFTLVCDYADDAADGTTTQTTRLPFPAITQSLQDCSSLTRLQLTDCANLSMAIALTKGNVKSQDIGLHEREGSLDIDLMIEENQMAKLWLALSRLKSLRILRWSLPWMLGQVCEIPEELVSSASGSQVSSLRTIEVEYPQFYDEVEDSDEIFWKTASVVFPQVSRLLVDADHLECVSTNQLFPLLTHLGLTSVDEWKESQLESLSDNDVQADPSMYLDSVVESLSPMYPPIATFLQKALFGYRNVTSIHVPHLIIAYVFLGEDDWFPSLRCVSYSPNLAPPAVPRLLEHIAKQCIPRQIRLFCETNDGQNQEYSRVEIDCEEVSREG